MDWNLQFVLPRVKLLLGRQAHAFAKHIPRPGEAEALANHLWIIHIRPTRVAGIGIALPDLVHGRAGGVIDAQRSAEQILMQNWLHGFRLVLHAPRVGEHHLRHGEREHLPIPIWDQQHLKCGAHLEITEYKRAAGRGKIGSLLRRDAWDILGFQSPTRVAPAVSIIGDSAPESYASNLERRQVAPPAHLVIHRHRAGGAQTTCHHDRGNTVGLRGDKGPGGKT